jgi:hypothetical protein
MDWRPRRSRDGWIGLAAIGVLLALDFVIRQAVAGMVISLTRFLLIFLLALSVPLLLLLAYWTYGFFTLRYHLDRNGLIIRWGGEQQIVPIGRIQAIEKGEKLTGQLNSFRGVAWPGYRIGRAQVSGVGPTLFRSTASLAKSLVVITPTLAYVISPADAEGFIATWKARTPLGATQSWRQEARLGDLLALPVWGDRLACGLIVATLLIGAAFIGYLWAIYPTLPMFIPLHFDAIGQVDRVGPKEEILRLPTIGLLVLLINLPLGFIIHRRERLAAYMAWWGACIVQVLLWIAALIMTG